VEILRAITSIFTRLALELVYRIEKESLAGFPRTGPLIVVGNHTGQVEAPIFYSLLYPRHMSALAKVENWRNPFLAIIFRIWEIVPIRRGEGDAQAMKKSLAALDRGYIFGVAPEGTRSQTRGLGRAQPGVALLALHSGAPILPVAHWGSENLGSNLKRLRRTDFNIRVGKPFKLDAAGLRVDRRLRQKMADEIMFQVAELLPPEYRGLYTDFTAASQDHIRFLNSA
jgi:1-acyl-sn-glycerol-3-phosphate acyltransferase